MRIPDPIQILISLPAVFLALSFHEFAHAYVANKMGDPTPKNQGRLTLDPFAHVDWIGLIMFAVFGFGWAKPVQVNPSNFRNKKRGNILVSLAGPIANMILAILGLVLLIIVLKVTAVTAIIQIIQRIIYLNIVFAILNLIPIPPFDGYHIIKDLFFRRNANFFFQYERYSILILFAFIFLRAFDILVGLPAQAIYKFFMEILILIISL